MPARSKTQQRLMGQALAYKRGELKSKDMDPKYADEIKKVAKSMTQKQLRDFAKTKHKNLPEKVEEKIKNDETQKHINKFEQLNNNLHLLDKEVSDLKLKLEKNSGHIIACQKAVADLRVLEKTYQDNDRKHVSFKVLKRNMDI